MNNLLKKAVQGDASAAALLWRGIAAADGTVSDADALAWVRCIAPDVVADVIDSDKPANEKAQKARRAIGLAGRIDKHDQFTKTVYEFPGITAKALAEVLPLVDEVPEGNLKRKIEYLRNKQKEN